MTERIPEAVLEREHRRILRHAAAVLIQAMAETDISFEQLDARLGKKPGWGLRQITDYITGKTTEMRIVSDLCCALGCRMQFGVQQIQWATAEDNAAAELEVKDVVGAAQPEQAA